MEGPRRRKKRASYGVRNISLTRSHQGFGFTISGQQPCLLSCIVDGSPAHKAGLRQGDYLIAVNGHNVAKSPHDDVVRLIGRTTGTLKLQIAASYFSSSSSDESVPHHHRCRPSVDQPPSSLSSSMTSLSSKSVRPRLAAAAVYRNEERSPGKGVRRPTPRNYGKPNAAARKVEHPDVVYCAVVGYLGTVEIPAGVHNPSAIHSSIRRLRTERKVHVTVLLQVHQVRVTLTNPHGSVIAEYPHNHIVSVDKFSDDRRVMGIITSQCSGCSCHVFLADQRLRSHRDHSRYAITFSLECIPPRCSQFPDTVDRAVSVLGAWLTHPAPSPLASSNSDSGISESRPPGFGKQHSRQDVPLCLRTAPDGERLGDNTLCEQTLGDMDAQIPIPLGKLILEPPKLVMSKGPIAVVEDKIEAPLDPALENKENAPMKSWCHADVTRSISDGGSGDTSPVNCVAAWAVSFDQLVGDPAGLHTFYEFLKTEYSQENVVFWAAIQRYRHRCEVDGCDEQWMHEEARRIHQRHVSPQATEPVNVDGAAKQHIETALANPTADMFDIAQKQIYNLMKFDCYPRFLKSFLYRQCMLHEMSGEPLPYTGEKNLLVSFDADTASRPATPTSTASNASVRGGERRRRSLLPWHRTRPDPTNTLDGKSNKLNSSFALRKSNSSLLGRRKKNTGEGTCTPAPVLDMVHVSLGSSSHEMVLRPGITVRNAVSRLLESLGILYSAFDLYRTGDNRAIEPSTECTALSPGITLRVEPRSLIRVDLPNKKSIGVKAKPSKCIADVLRPILHKYGYKMDLLDIRQAGIDKLLNPTQLSSELDSQRLIVETKLDYRSQRGRLSLDSAAAPAIRDEITNRVFQDLLHGKALAQFDELGVLDLDKKNDMPDDSTSDCGRSSSRIFGFPWRTRSSIAKKPLPKAETKSAILGKPLTRFLSGQSSGVGRPQTPGAGEATRWFPMMTPIDGRASAVSVDLGGLAAYHSRKSESLPFAAASFSSLDCACPEPEKIDKYFSCEMNSTVELGEFPSPESLPPPPPLPPPRPGVRPFAESQLILRPPSPWGHQPEEVGCKALPPPPTTPSTSIHIDDVADYSPPTPLGQSVTPPPLPPKPSAGPVTGPTVIPRRHPVKPSRPVSEPNAGALPPSKTTRPTTHPSQPSSNVADLTSSRSRKGLYIEPKNMEAFNISFV